MWLIYPGTYTLAGTNPAEREVIKYLTSNDVDVVVNVLDASHLSHGLTMTIELLELENTNRHCIKHDG